LIEVFRRLVEVSRDPNLNPTDKETSKNALEEIDRIIADIQFLGNRQQIEAALKIGREIGERFACNLNPLMNSLRRELRSELGRSKYRDAVAQLTAGSKPGGSMEREGGRE